MKKARATVRMTALANKTVAISFIHSYEYSMVLFTETFSAKESMPLRLFIGEPPYYLFAGAAPDWIKVETFEAL